MKILSFFFRNNVDDISQVEFLGMCSKLTHVTLEGNPLCVMPTPDSQQVYFERIFFYISSIYGEK